MTCERCGGAVRTRKPGHGWVCTRCVRAQKRAAGAAAFADLLRQVKAEAAPPPCTPAELSRLRAAMADAHPDRGGNTDQFTAARDRYVRARDATTERTPR